MNESELCAPVKQQSSASGTLPGVWVQVSLGTELRDHCEQASRRGEGCSQCPQHLSCPPGESLLPQGWLSWPRHAVGAQQKCACGSAAGSRCPSERGTELSAASTATENLARVSPRAQLEMLLGAQKGGHWRFPLLSSANLALMELFPGAGFSCLPLHAGSLADAI